LVDYFETKWRMHSRLPANIGLIACSLVYSSMTWSYPQKLMSENNPKRLLPPLETDCRFWLDAAAHARRLRHYQSSVNQRVFFWWNSKRGSCNQCTRCSSQKGMVTFIPCGYLRDTRCISQDEMNKILQQRRDMYYPDEQEYIEETDNDEKDEAVVIYNADKPVENSPEVFGKRQLHSAGESNSPTNEILQKRLNESGQLDRQKLLHVDSSPYGMPTFYTNSDKGTKNAVAPNVRPIVEVAKEFLSDRISGETSTSRYLKEGRGFKSLKKLLRTFTTSYPFVQNMNYDTTSRTVLETTTKEIKTTVEIQSESSFHPINQNPRPFFNDQEDDEELNTEETSSDYGIKHEEIDNDITTSSAGDTALRELFHMLEDNKDEMRNKVSNSVETFSNKHLESIFGIISLVVLILFCVLCYILFKSRARSKFQILDDQSNLESQHITSTFHNSNPEASQEKLGRAHLITNKVCGEEQHLSNSVPPAVVRSLRNIRKEVIVDEGGRAVVR